jgi:ribonuclease P protein component
VVLVWRTAEGPSEAGFAVSRQVRGAVPRNRLRRRLREAYRTNRLLLPPRVQVVFVARGTAVSRSFDDLCRDVRDGLKAIANRCQTTDQR